MIIFPELLQQLGFELRYHPLERIPYLLPPLCTIPDGVFLMGTEAEWEKAARGTDGRIYPWGNQWDASNANVQCEEGFSDDRSTTSIDTYAHAASPYGVVDMAGNIGEWTSTVYEKFIDEPELFSYPYVATDGREDMKENSQFRFRRLRRGDRLSAASMARAAARGFFHVDDRYDWLTGLRLALSVG